MRCAMLFQKNDIRIIEVPEPQVNAGEVKIRIAAAGICGSDIPRVLEGKVHSFPIVLGHEFSGVVVEIGKNVSNINVGDHVVGAPLLPCGHCPSCLKGDFSLCNSYSFIGSRQHGAFAEYIVLPASNVLRISPSIPLDHAIFFETSSVALHAFRHIGYQGGYSVAILGGGSVGLLALQWAKYLGALNVAVIGRNYEHLAVATRLGANAVFSSLDKDFESKVHQYTQGQGFNYIFEAAGSVSTMKMAFNFAANKARICFIGTPSNQLEFSPIEWNQINRKEFFLTGSWMGYSAPFPGDEWLLTRHCFEKGFLKIDEGMIHTRFPLEKISEAFSLFHVREKVSGRVIITM